MRRKLLPAALLIASAAALLSCADKEPNVVRTPVPPAPQKYGAVPGK
ncbi:MAG: hypothetical protein LAQ30_10635 [Acidobacteriia bacterium]|nr:hypothetical protein [Terriglobia bacterium]